MTKTLKIEFEMSNDKKLTLSLSAPKDDLTRAAIEAALKDVIDKNSHQQIVSYFHILLVHLKISKLVE